MKDGKLDSFGKLASSWFAAFTREEYEHAGVVYKPRDLMLSPRLAKTHNCFGKCAGCCFAVSLHYLPNEPLPVEESETSSDMFLGKPVRTVDSGSGVKCKYVDMDTGWCGIHGKHPFACDFAGIAVKMYKNQDRQNNVGVGAFGRAWTLKRIDGTKGAACTFDEGSDAGAKETVRKLKRLEEWMNYFSLKNCVSDAIHYLESGEWKLGSKSLRVSSAETTAEHFIFE